MKTVYLIFSLMLATNCFAQSIAARLDAAMKTMQSDEQFKHAIISLFIVDSKTGKPVYDKNSQTGLAPASCLKVVTSVAAFELLKKDYRYATALGYDGAIAGSNLNGNLFVKASGDPTLGSWRWEHTKMDTVLQRIVAALKQNNIAAINGDLIVDESKWETQATPRGWTWDDIGNYYGAGARALNWHENQYDLVLKPGKNTGDAVEVMGTDPELQVSALVNELRTGKLGSGDNSIIYLPEDGVTAYVRGTVQSPPGKTITVSGAMPNASVSFAKALIDLLQKNNISLSGKIKTGVYYAVRSEKTPEATKSLFEFYSPTLDSINYWFLQKSVNLYGEAMVKTIAYEEKEFGSTDSGVSIIKNFWAEKGIERSALNMIDGSGLSPANRVTTNALVTVMQYARKQDWFASFMNALPLQNGIKMKSGSIGGVRSYTGFVKSKTGADYSFAFIINNYGGSAGTVREKMWKLLDILK
jgi:serine-type D-Ala-D-Ala carboxypeptidase/endopeptidase (penicillin-binding protein 4)